LTPDGYSDRPCVFSEKDTRLAQNLGQPQRFTAVSTGMRGPTCIFWGQSNTLVTLLVARATWTPPRTALHPPRDSEPQKLLLGPKNYSLRRSPMENVSWALVTFLGGRNRARRNFPYEISGSRSSRSLWRMGAARCLPAPLSPGRHCHSALLLTAIA
jgi:hypothetical protein